jgi:hypothetical protein
VGLTHKPFISIQEGGRANLCGWVWGGVGVHVHTRMDTYMHMYIHTLIYIYMLTHTHMLARRDNTCNRAILVCYLHLKLSSALTVQLSARSGCAADNALLLDIILEYNSPRACVVALRFLTDAHLQPARAGTRADAQVHAGASALRPRAHSPHACAQRRDGTAGLVSQS